MAVGERSVFATGTARRKGSSPLQFPLSATAPMVWLPYTAIDQLLQALRESTANHYNVMVGTAAPGKRKGARKHPAEGRQGAPRGALPAPAPARAEGKWEWGVGWGGRAGSARL